MPTDTPATPTPAGLAAALALVDATRDKHPAWCDEDTFDAVFTIARAAVIRAMAWQDADTPEGDPVTYAMDAALVATIADLVRLATGDEA